MYVHEFGPPLINCLTQLWKVALSAEISKCTVKHALVATYIYYLSLYLATTCHMWPYFNVPLEDEIT